MQQKIVYAILNLFSAVTGKYFLYIKRSEHNQPGQTAIKDRFGTWHVGDVFDKDDFAFGIAQNGLVEETETHLFNQILIELKKTQSNLTVYDIGANIGYYGIMAATKFGAVTHSFEPLKEYADCITEASKLNGNTERMHVHNLALSDKNGDASFTKAGSGSSLEGNFNETANLTKITIKTARLDDLATELNLSLPDFVKIDVEGHELAALQGARQVLTQAQPVFFIELCTNLNGIGRSYVNPYYSETLKYFSDLGYQMFLIKDNNELECWDAGKSINKAGMFLCLNTSKHKDLLEILSATYQITK